MSADEAGDGAGDWRLLVLALTAGSVDAASYLGLAHAFPANMTGNTVLLAIALAHGGHAEFVPSAVALAGFSLGVIGGALLIGALGRRAASRSVLALHALALVAVLVVRLVFGPPSDPLRDTLLGGAGLAMGLQSVGVRAANPGGLAVTYVTGTLTNALARQTMRLTGAPESRDSRHTRRFAELDWLLYGLGALAGALLTLHVSRWAFAFPAALAMLGLAPGRPGPTAAGGSGSGA